MDKFIQIVINSVQARYDKAVTYGNHAEMALCKAQIKCLKDSFVPAPAQVVPAGQTARVTRKKSKV